ncbi:MAG: EamA family transporter [Candidatus Dormibacteraceae bacterium]
MAIALALLASAGYGVADFMGGVATRRLPVTTTTLLAHAAGLAVLLPALLLLPGEVSPGALLWGAGGGLLGGLSLLAFYHGLATGRMSLVSPLAAVLSAALPVGAGLLLGQRPPLLAAAGMGLGLVAIVLISLSRAHPGAAGPGRSIGFGIVAGLGFGLFFVCFDRAPADSGLWPLAGARMCTVVLFAVLVAATGGIRKAAPPPLLSALGAGLLDTGANALFLLALRQGQLGIVAVLASLYPAVTVALSVSLLHERPRWYQLGGIGLALFAVSLIALP